MGPEANNMGDELGREARAREDLGEDRRQAQGVRLRVALPAAGGVDPLEVCVRRSVRWSLVPGPIDISTVA